jgi:hypothetical protein
MFSALLYIRMGDGGERGIRSYRVDPGCNEKVDAHITKYDFLRNLTIASCVQLSTIYPEK